MRRSVKDSWMIWEVLTLANLLVKQLPSSKAQIYKQLLRFALSVCFLSCSFVYVFPIQYLTPFLFTLCSLFFKAFYFSWYQWFLTNILHYFFFGKNILHTRALESLPSWNICRQITMQTETQRQWKKRITLKLLVELYYAGVIGDGNILINIIMDARRQRWDATQTNLTLLASFARQERFFLGLPYFWRKISVKLANAKGEVSKDSAHLHMKSWGIHMTISI